MIGIQGETTLDEVTKSPADAALSTTSTNSVQNKVVTKEINDLNNDLDYFKDAKAINIKIVNNVHVTPNSGFGHESFTVPTLTGYYVFGAFAERADNGSYDVLAFIDPFKQRISVTCPIAITNTLTFNVVIIYAKNR